MITEPKSKEPKAAECCIMNTNAALFAVPVEKDSKLERKLAKLRATLPFQTEYAKGTFADELWQAMEHRSLNQVQFAQKAGVTKQFLTRVFRGGNCTIETMVRLTYPLNYKFHIHLTPNEVGCGWIHAWLPKTTPRPPDRFMKLWSETGYRPIECLTWEVKRETVPTSS